MMERAREGDDYADAVLYDDIPASVRRRMQGSLRSLETAQAMRGRIFRAVDTSSDKTHWKPRRRLLSDSASAGQGSYESEPAGGAILQSASIN
jgi:hypothetical protein